MNIMRKIGACWRCKFLRKTVSIFLIQSDLSKAYKTQCDPKSPCGMCPRKSSQTSWMAVGCQRGNFEDTALICPAARRIVVVSGESANRIEGTEASQGINMFHDREQTRRNQELSVLRSAGSDPMNDPRFKDTGISDLLQAILGHPVEAAMRPSLEPLIHCLLDIIWEFCMYGSYLPCSASELEGLRSMISVLFAAVKFQAALEAQNQTVSLHRPNLSFYRLTTIFRTN